MFTINDILYEDNHLIIVNKRAGDLVQSDPDGTEAIEDQIKAMIKIRDHKPGAVYLGVVHRIDRPVSGVVIFAKTSKALERINAQKDESFFTSRADFVLWNYPPYDINVEIKPITLQIGL